MIEIQRVGVAVELLLVTFIDDLVGVVVQAKFTAIVRGEDLHTVITGIVVGTWREQNALFLVHLYHEFGLLIKEAAADENVYLPQSVQGMFKVQLRLQLLQTLVI